ncbi:PINIT domain-containing protein [Gamsiella multidivaricata]|uniref:PINIT domain-containing protein n=1 Tax=Gamsiella multidivaricata TaxID=101098 RepID=UPI00221F3CA5|nr:PINIT domain-containing protein [Gamsiella multidivaricata]KAI7826077.1 PINIT domain-containing protein [Gamsiella multidivaricata]
MEDLSTITGRIIPSLLVTQLKALIKSLNETIRPPPHLKLSGNKPELITRLVGFVTQYHQIGDQVAIRQIRQCVAAYSSGDVSTIATPSVPLHHPHNNSSNSPIATTPTTTSLYNRNPQPSSSASTPSMLTSRGPGQPTSHHASSSVHRTQFPVHHSSHQYRPGMSSHGPPHQTFKPSPFYQDMKTLSDLKLCLEAKDRTLSVPIPFNVPPMLAMQLKKDPQYQLMVFCAWADGNSGGQVLMEFPHVCEIKVNGRVLEANLRGMKNKPGTVSPANITRLCRLESGDYNKIEFMYANSTKRYYASVHLVKKFSVELIVAEVERGKFLSKEKMLQMIEDRNKDEDIMATSSTLSLKCPLGFQRINIPCRSQYCHHLQCFDAFTFFNLNEQTPTWTCPVCSRVMLSWEEIVVDGYFKDILSSTPKSLESITVQADGSWEIPSSSTQTEAAPSPKKKLSAPSGDSVFVIDEDDSDDEEEEAVAAPTPVPSKPAVVVIDLISDSEDEEEDTTPASQVDAGGDAVMEDAATSLQNMAQSGSGRLPSVKTEMLDKPTPTESAIVPPPVEIHSISGSNSASPASASSSGASPLLLARMVQPESIQTGLISPTSRMAGGWETNEDSFMNVLLNPRRKRQFDDAGDSDSPNSMAYETRQRIARLDIRSSNVSTDGSASTVNSPDVIGRSTSSPTPVPTLHDYDRRGVSEHQAEVDGMNNRARREYMPNRPIQSPFLENGGHTVSGPASTVGQKAFVSHHSPQHHQSHHRSSRSVTMSPPLQYGYSGASPRHHQHHHSAHRSSDSPGIDYYTSVSRPSSSASMAPNTSMSSRSNSLVTDRPLSGVPSAPLSGGSSSAWSSADGYTNGNQDRVNRWSAELRPNTYGANTHMSFYESSRRISGEEARASTMSNPSSPEHRATTSKYSSPHYSHPSVSQSPNHQRHHSNDDVAIHRRYQDQNNGAWDHSRNGREQVDEYDGYGSHQHVLNSNQHGPSGNGDQITFSPSPRSDEAPIFLHGLRGARAR